MCVPARVRACPRACVRLDRTYLSHGNDDDHRMHTATRQRASSNFVAALLSEPAEAAPAAAAAATASTTTTTTTPTDAGAATHSESETGATAAGQSNTADLAPGHNTWSSGVGGCFCVPARACHCRVAVCSILTASWSCVRRACPYCLHLCALQAISWVSTDAHGDTYYCMAVYFPSPEGRSSSALILVSHCPVFTLGQSLLQALVELTNLAYDPQHHGRFGSADYDCDADTAPCGTSHTRISTRSFYSFESASERLRRAIPAIFQLRGLDTKLPLVDPGAVAKVAASADSAESAISMLVKAAVYVRWRIETAGVALLLHGL